NASPEDSARSPPPRRREPRASSAQGGQRRPSRARTTAHRGERYDFQDDEPRERRQEDRGHHREARRQAWRAQDVHGRDGQAPRRHTREEGGAEREPEPDDAGTRDPGTRDAETRDPGTRDPGEGAREGPGEGKGEGKGAGPERPQARRLGAPGRR